MNDELINEAIKRYPIGTVFKSPFYDHKVFKVTGDDYNPRYNRDKSSIILSETGAVYDCENKVWAEIVSYPVGYVKEEIVNDYLIF